MNHLSKYKILLFIAGVILLASCQRVVVVVDQIPANTPENQPLYITGNFNNWDPGDESYQMFILDDSSFFVNLPPGFGTVEYKFTRGDWTTVETDICGYDISNRKITLGDGDTVVNGIESWNDLDPLNCPRLTLLLRDIPPNTTTEEVIAIAGNFNSWAFDSAAVFTKDTTGNYSVTIERPSEIEELEFKFTRGDLSKAESDEFGNIVPNRTLRFGIKDTVEVKIEGWIDRPGEKSNRVVVILNKVPPFTNYSDKIFLASSLNNWTAGDKNYEFQRNKNGQLFFPIPRKKKVLEYKITRGEWSSVEVDKYGYEIENRNVALESVDTVYIDVENWKDQARKNDYEVTIVIQSLPLTTPENPRIYLAANFNGWHAGRSKFRFQEDNNGQYILNVPRTSGYFEYKITRGSWDAAEVDAVGEDMPNRKAFFANVDSIYIDVVNWKDKPVIDYDMLTIVINDLPDNTPENEIIYLAPDFNGWDPGNPEQAFYYLPDGRPYITIPTQGRQLIYKITRGDWNTVEVDENGNTISDRVITYGFTDTVYIDVIKWRDFDGNY